MAFNPNRLSIARKRRRLTAKKLAELARLSPITITRLQTTSKHEPDDATLDVLAEVLNFPRKFFFGDDVDELDKSAASFRSLTAMSALEREAALSAGSIAYLLSDWVHERFNLPSASLIDLGRERDTASAARSLRQYWGLGEKPISNMIRLLESKGVRVFSLAENTRNVDAFSCWRNDVPYVFLNTFKSPEHSRFDAAHELGHLIFHRHGGPQQGGRDAEREANNFASSFLMPRADVLANLPRPASLDQLVRAKRRWGVSVAALAYRLHDLKLLTDWQYRLYCININKRGYRTDEPNQIPREESTVWKKVFTQLWNERITKKHVADEIGVPVDELENLVFGLVGSTRAPAASKPDLRVV
jgi:Zn-dependent peptidase ImmA (M78 family)